MEDPVAPKGFVNGNARLDELLAKRPVNRAAVDAEKERLAQAVKRDEAVRKVAHFLKVNYPCYCDGVEECDELDEAAEIVEIVEGILC